MTEALIGLIPTAGVLFLFWLVIRAFLSADRREREAQARLDREERERNARESSSQELSSRKETGQARGVTEEGPGGGEDGVGRAPQA